MPAAISSDNIGKVLNLATYAPGVLGSNFQRVKLVGILDYRSVFSLIDPAAVHANVYPSLPSGVPNNYSKYSYAKFEYSNGKEFVLGIPWINQDTVEIVEQVKFTVEIFDEDITKFNAIRDALIQAGINNFVINTD